MPRRARILIPDGVYHVINRGNQRQPIFHSDDDYFFYRDLLFKAKNKYGIKIFHYVLMPNHIHLLIKPEGMENLSKFMQGLTIAHTRHFNAKYGKVGHAWQSRFRSILIDSESYMLQCGRYIELNPVRARIVTHPAEYRWSSFAHYASLVFDPMVDLDFMLPTLSPNLDEQLRIYRGFCEEEIPKIHAGIATRFSEEDIYGSAAFVAKVKNAL
ncbi:MAG: Transposase-like protein [Candidatus Magasanikbacteria bacterium]|nr:Transposase-like protein [Candidatus Magasanikbacteria bacterium]